tara:strand:- start:129 stop:821 length:693 start_codon:yes stop_codon:yes gene_type:complete
MSDAPITTDQQRWINHAQKHATADEVRIALLCALRCFQGKAGWFAFGYAPSPDQLRTIGQYESKPVSQSGVLCARSLGSSTVGFSRCVIKWVDPNGEINHSGVGVDDILGCFVYHMRNNSPLGDFNGDNTTGKSLVCWVNHTINDNPLSGESCNTAPLISDEQIRLAIGPLVLSGLIVSRPWKSGFDQDSRRVLQLTDRAVEWIEHAEWYRREHDESDLRAFLSAWSGVR